MNESDWVRLWWCINHTRGAQVDVDDPEEPTWSCTPYATTLCAWMLMEARPVI